MRIWHVRKRRDGDDLRPFFFFTEVGRNLLHERSVKSRQDVEREKLYSILTASLSTVPKSRRDLRIERVCDAVTNVVVMIILMS